MKQVFIVLLLTILFASAQAQIITTIAGTGSYAESGDGGPATAADVIRPDGLAFSNIGELYLGNRSKIRKINRAGIITAFAGSSLTSGFGGDGGPATAARFATVAGIVFDVNCNMYIADDGNNRIRKIDTFGIVTTFAGNGASIDSGDGGPATAAALKGVLDVAVDSRGNLFIADGWARVRKVNALGIISTVAGNGISGYGGDGSPATAAMVRPDGIAVDSVGNLYIAEPTRIRKVNTFGIITTIAGTGFIGYTGDGGPATAAQVSDCRGIYVDGANVYIADQAGNNCIRKIDASGIITTIAGRGYAGFSGDGGPATAAELNGVHHIARYGSGNMYFTDRTNNRVRMIGINNHAPYFTRGRVQHTVMCAEFTTIDTLLPVMDADTAQILNWSLVRAPLHGTAVTAYTAPTTGGIITPLGMTYAPHTGYTGPDTFAVRATDDIGSDTTLICVTVTTCALAAKVPERTLSPVFRVFPNPNHGKFRYVLASPTAEDATFVITDMIGARVAEFKGPVNKVGDAQLTVPPGVYYITAATPAGRWTAKVVVVE